jgi:hypothetical protein
MIQLKIVSAAFGENGWNWVLSQLPSCSPEFFLFGRQRFEKTRNRKVLTLLAMYITLYIYVIKTSCNLYHIKLKLIEIGSVDHRQNGHKSNHARHGGRQSASDKIVE